MTGASRSRKNIGLRSRPKGLNGGLAPHFSAGDGPLMAGSSDVACRPRRLRRAMSPRRPRVGRKREHHRCNGTHWPLDNSAARGSIWRGDEPGRDPCIGRNRPPDHRRRYRHRRHWVDTATGGIGALGWRRPPMAVCSPASGAGVLDSQSDHSSPSTTSRSLRGATQTTTASISTIAGRRPLSSHRRATWTRALGTPVSSREDRSVRARSSWIRPQDGYSS